MKFEETKLGRKHAAVEAAEAAIRAEFAVIAHKPQTVVPTGPWHFRVLEDGDYEVANGPARGQRFSIFEAADRAAHKSWIPRLRALLPPTELVHHEVQFDARRSSVTIWLWPAGAEPRTFGSTTISLGDVPFGGLQTLPKGWTRK